MTNKEDKNNITNTNTKGEKNIIAQKQVKLPSKLSKKSTMHFKKYEWFTLSLYCYVVLHGASNHYQAKVAAIQPQLVKKYKIICMKR